MAKKLNVIEVIKVEHDKEIVKKRIERLLQFCFENPEISVDVLAKFFSRQIKWEDIKRFMLNGELVKCEICGEHSVTAFWCKPCIHKKWCCFCCVLLGVPQYH